MFRSNIFLMLFVSVAFAAERPTYQFLQNDVSARASAMAGSFISMNGDPTGIFYNPASIGTSLSPQASFGYTSHLLDINTGFVAYSQEFQEIGVVGIGVNYVNYGSFNGRDEFGVETGTFNAGDLALSLSVSRPIEENLYLGGTAKFIHSSIADANSSAIAADLGLLFLIPGDDPISLGVVLSNIGTQIDKYGNESEPLPFEIKIGGTIKPQHLPLQLNLNFHKLSEERENFVDVFSAFSVGGEFTLSKALRFRFGYSNERRKELKIGTTTGMAGFSLGGGLILKNMRVDYSFNSYGLIGGISRITLGLDV